MANKKKTYVADSWKPMPKPAPGFKKGSSWEEQPKPAPRFKKSANTGMAAKRRVAGAESKSNAANSGRTQQRPAPNFDQSRRRRPAASQTGGRPGVPQRRINSARGVNAVRPSTSADLRGIYSKLKKSGR